MKFADRDFAEVIRNYPAVYDKDSPAFNIKE